MEQLSIALFWVALGTTGLSAAVYLLYVFGQRMAVGRAATDAGNLTVATAAVMPESLAWVGRLGAWTSTAVLTASLAARWIAAGRPPYSNMWEFTVAFAWGISVCYVFFEYRYRQRSLGAFVQPVTFALLLVATLFPSEISPLVPALQNDNILAYHVGAMILSYSAFSVAFGAAVTYLIQGKSRRFSRLPKADTLDAIAYRAVLVGFPLLALGLLLGAYWGNSAWGRYWGWDPKETSALVTWLIFAGYLHVRNLSGWRGTRSAWLVIIGFVAVVFTFYGVNLWVSGLHSYAGV
ncbi:MAG TPA: c-type cytochrome biogenesis protein CcsB [Dehalococcoidia bacterium]|nr:c-type cytochrome biogenesis protein CcsB [Dehalococcoidia bacterium]